MTARAILLTIIAFSMTEVACGQSTFSPLVFYARAESLPPGSVGSKVEITFYPDGLIHAYRVTDAGRTTISVEVARHGNTITPVYLENNGSRYFSISGCTVVDNQATIKLQGAKGERDELAIKPLTSTAPGKIYEMDYKGNPVATFAFAPSETELNIPQQGVLYKYRIAKGSGLITVLTSGSDDIFTSSLGEGGTVVIVRKSMDGMPLWSFSANGHVFRANPLVAIFNYELVDDGIVGTPIFPYVGAGPE